MQKIKLALVRFLWADSCLLSELISEMSNYVGTVTFCGEQNRLDNNVTLKKQ
jgi:hypothetical protein